jgi:hypothetical protein
MSVVTQNAEPKPRRRVWHWIVAVAVLAIVVPSPKFYRQYQQGQVCTSCHEIWEPYNDWHTSAHRNVACSACHGEVFTSEAGFHLNNMRRVFSHLRSDVPDKPHLRTTDTTSMMERCRACHQQEFATWRSGRHSATYKDIFLNEKQNQRQLLIDDCLRCHGMHFQGSIRDLIEPVSRTGPWLLKDVELAGQPAVPCLACHRVHRQGSVLPASKEGQSIPGPQQEITRPSISFLDRRSSEHVSVADLPLPQMLDGKRPVNISPDQRQALCYQCHAPRPERQVNSGDDRTPIGVHEGLSCFACHGGHGDNTHASCATCHPRLSNCGIPVERMDTTFKDKSSKYNIHFVKCTDCHTEGVPKKAHLIHSTPAVSERHSEGSAATTGTPSS